MSLPWMWTNHSKAWKNQFPVESQEKIKIDKDCEIKRINVVDVPVEPEIKKRGRGRPKKNKV